MVHTIKHTGQRASSLHTSSRSYPCVCIRSFSRSILAFLVVMSDLPTFQSIDALVPRWVEWWYCNEYAFTPIDAQVGCYDGSICDDCFIPMPANVHFLATDQGGATTQVCRGISSDSRILFPLLVAACVNGANECPDLNATNCCSQEDWDNLGSADCCDVQDGCFLHWSLEDNCPTEFAGLTATLDGETLDSVQIVEGRFLWNSTEACSYIAAVDYEIKNPAPMYHSGAYAVVGPLKPGTHAVNLLYSGVIGHTWTLIVVENNEISLLPTASPKLSPSASPVMETTPTKTPVVETAPTKTPSNGSATPMSPFPLTLAIIVALTLFLHH